MLRDAADALAANDPSAQPVHDGHSFPLKPRSSRPLVHKTDLAALPPIDPKGVNVLPWTVVTETVVDRKFHPSFPKYLKELDGKQVPLTGFMQPLGEEQEAASFMLIEYPVGCWYCEMPEVTGIVMWSWRRARRPGSRAAWCSITGRLRLNATDPEDFLYTIKDARRSKRGLTGARSQKRISTDTARIEIRTGLRRRTERTSLYSWPLCVVNL